MKETVTGLPSAFGPLLPRSAVGATLATVTVKVLVSLAPFLSVTLTVTVRVAGPSA